MVIFVKIFGMKLRVLVFSIAVLLFFQSCNQDSCSNTTCLEEPQFRFGIFDGNTDSNLVFGAAKIYEPDSVKLYHTTDSQNSLVTLRTRLSPDSTGYFYFTPTFKETDYTLTLNGTEIATIRLGQYYKIQDCCGEKVTNYKTLINDTLYCNNCDQRIIKFNP